MICRFRVTHSRSFLLSNVCVFCLGVIIPIIILVKIYGLGLYTDKCMNIDVILFLYLSKIGSLSTISV